MEVVRCERESSIESDLSMHCRFCPSVFFYLCTVIPSVWFLELDLAQRRSKFNVTQALGLVPGPQGSFNLESDETLPVNVVVYFSYTIERQGFFFRLARAVEDSGGDVDTDRRADPSSRARHWPMVAARRKDDDT